MTDPVYEPLQGYEPRPSAETMLLRVEQFLQTAKRRRSVRDFSDVPVPRAVIEGCLQVAGTAPSGANQQPWHFAAVSDPEVKRRIRLAAEAEEREFYGRRAPDEWLQALAPIGTDAQKPFLEVAPWLIAVFAQSYGAGSASTTKHYYVSESVGIATGMLIAALNACGLATLTHTPSPMNFLSEVLGRPKSERPYLLLVVGFPAADCQVPTLEKKSLDEIASFHE